MDDDDASVECLPVPEDVGVFGISLEPDDVPLSKHDAGLETGRSCVVN